MQNRGLQKEYEKSKGKLPGLQLDETLHSEHLLVGCGNPAYCPICKCSHAPGDKLS